MTIIRPKDAPRVTVVSAGDTVTLDGATFRSILYTDFLAAIHTPTQSLVTAAGDVTLLDTEINDVIGINNTSGAAINVFLPDAAVRTKKITIVDKGGNALTHNITVKPKAASGQTIMTGAQYVLDSNGSSIGLTPWSDATGYY